MTFGQLQEIRTYYDFVSVDDDRYWIDGKYRQVLLSPRELNAASLPTRTFINEHLTFTHGMGLTLGPVNQVTTEGLPVLFVQDLPPGLERLAQGHPAADLLRRAGQRLRLRGDPAAGVRPSVGRRQRLRRLRGQRRRPGGQSCSAGWCWRRASAPPRSSSPSDITDEQPGPLLPEHHGPGGQGAPVPAVRPGSLPGDHRCGTLEWILDAYTTTDRYPYSQRLDDGTSYMRNSVKVRDRRLRRIGHGRTSAPRRSADPDLVADLPRHLPAARQHAGRPAGAPALSGRPLPDPDQPLHHLPHGCRRRTSTTGRTSGRSRWSSERDGSVPFMRHIVMRLPDEPQGGVHLHGAVHAAGEGQPGGVDGGPERRRGLRQAPGLPPVPAEPGLRAAADREPDQPEHRDLPAGLAVGPARLAGDPGRPAGDPDRGEPCSTSSRSTCRPKAAGSPN